MPHLVVLYTHNLEADADFTALSRRLADAMLALRAEDCRQVFPTGGTRVLCFPTAHFAVADGQRDYAFIYLNLRMARGRSDAVKKQAGDALSEAVKEELAPVFARRLLGLTLQIDEGQEVYDAKHSNIHPLFNKA
jgi:5-carboxymethyl-2-hydroxymuconate isomerase